MFDDPTMCVLQPAQGKTVLQHFQDLQAEYGSFININKYALHEGALSPSLDTLTMPFPSLPFPTCTPLSYLLSRDPAVTDAIFVRIRAGGYPTSCGGLAIVGVRDLTEGVDTAYDDGKPRLPVSKSSHYITFYFENG